MPMGMRLGRTTEPKLAPMPIFASGSPMRTPGAATRRSQASASSKPPATAVLLADLVEVEPGAEGRPGGGEDDRADVAVLPAAQQLLDEVALQRAGQRVAALRAVQGEHTDVPALLDDESGLPALCISHAGSL